MRVKAIKEGSVRTRGWKTPRGELGPVDGIVAAAAAVLAAGSFAVVEYTSSRMSAFESVLGPPVIGFVESKALKVGTIFETAAIS